MRPKRSAYSAQFKLLVLSHQDREKFSSRQVAAVYDIQIPTRWWSGDAISMKAGGGSPEKEARAPQYEDGIEKLEAGVHD